MGRTDDARHGPRQAPANRLSGAERTVLLATVNSAPFRDLSPHQIVPRLADLGRYLASESTIYRVLRAERLLADRGRANAPRGRAVRAHVATGPNQVWTWDITYLRTPVRGRFLYLYLMMDIWSRKIVGWAVHDSESATMVVTLERLGVLASFSRPGVSNDNPFSESRFRTLKCRPDYPAQPFADLAACRRWAGAFVRWYNTEPLHSAIQFVTPADRHAGCDVAILTARRTVYAAARTRCPDCWSDGTRNWAPPTEVTLNPEAVEASSAAPRVA